MAINITRPCDCCCTPCPDSIDGLCADCTPPAFHVYSYDYDTGVCGEVLCSFGYWQLSEAKQFAEYEVFCGVVVRPSADPSNPDNWL